MDRRFIASILLCALLIAFAYGLFRHLTYTKIRVENASDDTITAVEVLTSYGDVFPIALNKDEGKVSFAPKSDGSVSICFERNGIVDKTENYGYITSNLGTNYKFTIQNDDVKFEMQ